MSRPSPSASPAASDDEAEDGILNGATEEEAEGENQVDVMDCIEGLIEFATCRGGETTGFDITGVIFSGSNKINYQIMRNKALYKTSQVCDGASRLPPP